MNTFKVANWMYTYAELGAHQQDMAVVMDLAGQEVPAGEGQQEEMNGQDAALEGEHAGMASLQYISTQCRCCFLTVPSIVPK